MTRAFIIARQRKGGKVRTVVGEVRRALQAASWKVDWVIVTRKRDLTRKTARAVKKGYDVVVIVGGDGAVLQVAPSLARTKVALGIIPTGTGNQLACNLHIPPDPGDAARMIVSGRRRQIDLGRVSIGGAKCGFSVACGIGFAADVRNKTGPGQKRRLGRFAYLANVVSQAGEISNVPHEITLDGVRTKTDAAQVFIANFGWMLAGMEPVRPLAPDDGLLDVIVVRASGRLSGA